MNNIVLIEPNESYSEQIIEYRNEFISNDEFINGGSNLIKFENPVDWIQSLKMNLDIKTCPKNKVPASEFIAVRKSDNRIVGMINIRHALNDYLLNYGGHIGYSIRKSERNKGYGSEQLKLALLECKKIGIEKVLITCNKENVGSRKTILSAKGIFENEVIESDNEIIQRFWFDIK